MSTINASNATDEDHQVALTSSNGQVTAVSNIKSTTDYDVEVKYSDSDTPAYTGTAIAGATTAKSEKGYVFEINIK